MRKIFVILLCFFIVGCQSKEQNSLNNSNGDMSSDSILDNTYDNEPNENETTILENQDELTEEDQDTFIDDKTQQNELIVEKNEEIRVPITNSSQEVVDSCQNEEKVDNNQNTSETVTTNQNDENANSTVESEKNQELVIEEPIKNVVNITITCKNILNNREKLDAGYVGFIPNNGVVLPQTEVEIKDGDTVLTVLKRIVNKNNISIRVKSGYVQSIANIDEFACGKESGWMYSVNSKFVNASSKDFKVKSGDSIEWQYTCENGRDINFK